MQPRDRTAITIRPHRSRKALESLYVRMQCQGSYGLYGMTLRHNLTVWSLAWSLVPDVMITDWNLSNTGFTARDASRQQSCSSGSFTPDTMLPCKVKKVSDNSVQWHEVIVAIMCLSKKNCSKDKIKCCRGLLLYIPLHYTASIRKASTLLQMQSRECTSYWCTAYFGSYTYSHSVMTWLRCSQKKGRKKRV